MFIILYCVVLGIVVKFYGMELMHDVKSAIIFVVGATIGLYLSVEINSIPKKLRAR